MPTRHKALLVTAIGAAAAVIVIAVINLPESEDIDAVATRQHSPAALLNLAGAEATPVEEAVDLEFPRDHLAHRAYRTEAWSLHGILTRSNGREMTVGLTILRLRLHESAGERPSRWAASEVYAGFLVVTDPDTGRPESEQRISRAAAGLAGADRDSLRVWIEDWHIEFADTDTGFGARSRLAAADLALELAFASAAPPAVRDSSAADARVPFAFYTQARIDAHGEISARGRRWQVDGRFVLEHGWGELPLPGSPVARDRFILFLDDGRELVLTRTHRRDGSGMPRITGLLLDRDGAAGVLRSDQLRMALEDHWSSKRSGSRYPVAWRLGIDAIDAELRLFANAPDQEVEFWAPLWMGPVRLEDDAGVVGTGSMILDGYEQD